MGRGGRFRVMECVKSVPSWGTCVYQDIWGNRQHKEGRPFAFLLAQKWGESGTHLGFNQIKKRVLVCCAVCLLPAWTWGPYFVSQLLWWDKTMPSEHMLIMGGSQRGSPSCTLPGVQKLRATGLGLRGKRCSYIWKSSVPEPENTPIVGMKLSFVFSGWLWPVVDPCGLAQWKHTWSLLEGNW